MALVPEVTVVNEVDEKTWFKVANTPEVWSYAKTNERFFDLRMLAVRLNDQSLLIVL